MLRGDSKLDKRKKTTTASKREPSTLLISDFELPFAWRAAGLEWEH